MSNVDIDETASVPPETKSTKLGLTPAGGPFDEYRSVSSFAAPSLPMSDALREKRELYARRRRRLRASQAGKD